MCKIGQSANFFSHPRFGNQTDSFFSGWVRILAARLFL